ncbi:hypothetical protein C1J05_04085 [Sulfitobacter sp. JL08]|uniref:VPLPA-CTERM sorting domain-containing protein n=1 Tax=Sulfitobacter sp. JL08 TaxID=2070369 RepID=UPI000E0B81C5|nr:VPLPA-CTERM sorting domain-containing protein [Sulfitobacter sp. JL08]AXI53788.1 hypothetical protein C1J05_04085 [Sulfitobacter sp. JL08]
MMKKILMAAVVSLWGVAVSTSAQAATVTYTLTLEQTLPDASIIVGSFGIDDSLLVANSFINFASFDFFDINIEGFTWSLAEAESPNIDGVQTDGSGDVINWSSYNNVSVLFCSFGQRGVCFDYLQLSQTSTFWRSGVDIGLVSEARVSGSWRIAAVTNPPLGPPPPGCIPSNYTPPKCEPWRPDGLSAVPLPAALPMLLAGIGGLGFIGRRRKRKAKLVE